MVRPANLSEVDPPPRRGEGEGQGADRALGSALSAGELAWRLTPAATPSACPISSASCRDWATSVPSGVQSSPSSSKKPSRTMRLRKRPRRSWSASGSGDPEVDRQVDRRRGGELGQARPRRGEPGVGERQRGRARPAGALRSGPSSRRPRRSTRRRRAVSPKRGCIVRRCVKSGGGRALRADAVDRLAPLGRLDLAACGSVSSRSGPSHGAE